MRGRGQAVGTMRGQIVAMQWVVARNSIVWTTMYSQIQHRIILKKTPPNTYSFVLMQSHAGGLIISAAEQVFRLLKQLNTSLRFPPQPFLTETCIALIYYLSFTADWLSMELSPCV